MPTANQAVRIGLVLVHGVGEQRRFDHLGTEVRNLVAALSTFAGVRVSVETRTTQDSATGAAHESWRADGSSPVKIHVTQDGRRYCLCVHEVWWADLDDKETLWNRLKFWLWGLGFWFVRKFSETGLPGAKRYMRPPRFASFGWGGNSVRELIVRARLFTFAVVFLLSALTVNLANYVLQRFRLGQLPLGLEVFYQFVGDVKLYQDRGKPQLGPLTDLGAPRRVAIRRRMVQVLLDAYRAHYDRWYILAHSLGSVVALNGIMETAHALPNYLSQETWASLANDPVVGKLPANERCGVSNMWPPRPVWVAADDAVLDRKTLFARLRGLVTYGSPLDKFAYLWPQIVNINNDADPWRAANGSRSMPFEWLNVFEHTDPVAAHLSAYGDPESEPCAPNNFAYKASRMLLLGHLSYLGLRDRRSDSAEGQLAPRLLAWMLAGDAPFVAPSDRRYWYARQSWLVGALIRAPMWLAATGLFMLLLAYLGLPAILDVLAWLSSLPLFGAGAAPTFFERAEQMFTELTLPERMLLVLFGSVAIVFLAGLARRALDLKPREGEPQRKAKRSAAGEPAPEDEAEVAP